MHLKTCSKYIRVKIDISEKRNKQIHNYTWKFPHSGLSSRYKKETEIQQRHKRFKNAVTTWVGQGGRWEGGSRRRGHMLYLWLIHVDVWQKPTQYCKAIILQLGIHHLKNNFKKHYKIKLYLIEIYKNNSFHKAEYTF